MRAIYDGVIHHASRAEATSRISPTTPVAIAALRMLTPQSACRPGSPLPPRFERHALGRFYELVAYVHMRPLSFGGTLTVGGAMAASAEAGKLLKGSILRPGHLRLRRGTTALRVPAAGPVVVRGAEDAMSGLDYDVLVIGSGFGGSVAALR